jgi:hypothetical protein
MSGDDAAGVAFPVAADGRRSTSALGRAVVADALRRADPAGALQASRERNWRTGYPAHFRRLIDAGLTSRQAAVSVARDGLASLHQRMRVASRDGPETGLSALVSAPARHMLTAVAVAGRGRAERELSVPYRGERLSGDALLRQLDAWVTAGVIEPSCADAVRAVAACPEWLALPGRTVVALGAGAEIGPLPVLLGWGARVIGVDLPRPAIWARVLETARRSGGTLLVPVSSEKPAPGAAVPEEDRELARHAGLDLADDVPAVADWLAGVDGPLVLGNYVYADGAANVRVSSAVDVLTVRLLAERRDIALGFLSTPTDVFAVPAEAVAYSARAYVTSSAAARLGRWSLRTISGGRLLRPGYPPGADPGICDALVRQQGPNYALAKRLQRWRATVARDGGVTVSMNVAPPTRTRSVTKNRVLAAAYAGAPRFGLEVFEAATTKTLMAALLVHDLHTGGGPAQEHPWQDEAHGAAHGGMWRVPYAPRSALGLAALLGYRATGKPGGLPGRRRVGTHARGLPPAPRRVRILDRGCPVSARGSDVSGEAPAECDRVTKWQGGTMKYMILMYGSQRNYDGMAGSAEGGQPAWSAADFAAMGAFMESFGEDLAGSGELVDAQGLAAPVHARRIRLRDGVPVVTDGPYAETEEVLAGYWLVDCGSFDRATEIAARLTNCPGPEHVRDRAFVDVRPVAESRSELEP